MVGPRPAGGGGAPYGGAEWPASPRRWRGTCGDGARAPRVPASRPASPGDHGAPGARADPAELAGGEPQPAGARHRTVRQVRAPRTPRGCGWRGALPEMDSRRLNRKGPEGEGRLARCLGAGALPDVRQRSERSDGWRSPFCAPHLPTSHLQRRTRLQRLSGDGRGSSPADLLPLRPAGAAPRAAPLPWLGSLVLSPWVVPEVYPPSTRAHAGSLCWGS